VTSRWSRRRADWLWLWLTADEARESCDCRKTTARQLLRDEYVARITARSCRVRRVRRQWLRWSDDVQRRPVLRRLSSASHCTAGASTTHCANLHQVPASASEGTTQSLRDDDGGSWTGRDSEETWFQDRGRVGWTRGKFIQSLNCWIGFEEEGLVP